MSEQMLRGMFMAMEQMGAVLEGQDATYLYFNVKKGSDIDDEGKLKRAKEAFEKLCGLGLKIKKV